MVLPCGRLPRWPVEISSFEQHERIGRLARLITAEPLPSRIASLALGTSDLDCVYHIALPELTSTIDELSSRGAEEQKHSLETLVFGKRLRDIADLPLDLSI
mgnify:CR=1 FL=1